MWEQILFDSVRIVVSFFVVLTLAKNYLFLILAPIYPVREKLRFIRYARRAQDSKATQDMPLISVIVPAWNEEVGVVKTIESIAKNGYPRTELIVVDDGSTDSTLEVIKKHFAEAKSRSSYHNLKVIIVSQTNQGKGAALNNAVKRASGEIILTVDADSMLKKGALKNLVKYYLDDRVMAVVGNVEVANSSTLVGFAQQLEYYFGFYNKRAHALLDAEYIFGGACASFRSSVFDRLGGFDTENKTEDIEMSMRIRAAGYKCNYAEDVICYTEGASDFRSLISQRVRWKKGRIDTFKKYKRLFFSTEEHHNFFLSFFILPFSVLSEIQLLFEPAAIAILITYSLITSEYLSSAIGIMYILLVYISVSLFHDNRKRPELVLLFPFTWPLFYVLDLIEFLALYKSLRLIRRGQDVEWQQWQRQGLVDVGTKAGK